MTTAIIILAAVAVAAFIAKCRSRKDKIDKTIDRIIMDAEKHKFDAD
jgi:hypothetical protein